MNLLYLVRHFVHRPKDFYRVFVISQNAALFQISRYLLSSKSRFGINHTQWHRLFQGKASTIINGIDCYQERHRPLKVASLVYERENCAPTTTFSFDVLNLHQENTQLNNRQPIVEDSILFAVGWKVTYWSRQDSFIFRQLLRASGAFSESLAADWMRRNMLNS